MPAVGRARARDRLRSLEPLAHPPLFILGHYRSGTTLVHKLVAADARWGTVTTLDLVLPLASPALQRWLGPMLQRTADALQLRQGFFYDYPLRLDDPNEVEPWLLAAGSAWSGYWGYVFPREALRHLDRFVRLEDPAERASWKLAYDHALRRLTTRRGGRPLVVKDPLNTGRVSALLALWPDARFVHVLRDPEPVLLSTRALWHDTILPRFALQRVTTPEVERVVLGHYETIMEAWASERARIPARQIVEVRYEDLVKDPLHEIKRAYRHLGLLSFETARASMSTRLARDFDYQGGGYTPPRALPKGWEAAIARWRNRLGYGTGAWAPRPSAACSDS